MLINNEGGDAINKYSLERVLLAILNSSIADFFTPLCIIKYNNLPYLRV
jgi:hypothetical protein